MDDNPIFTIEDFPAPARPADTGAGKAARSHRCRTVATGLVFAAAATPLIAAERKTLLEHGFDLHVIIGLGAVRAWHLDDPDVTIGQIRHLAEAAEAGGFRFGALPDFARVPFPPSQGFTILDDDQARVDHLTGELVLTAPDQVQAHADVFNEPAAASVYGRDAQELLLAEIQNVGASWRPEAPR